MAHSLSQGTRFLRFEIDINIRRKRHKYWDISCHSKSSNHICTKIYRVEKQIQTQKKNVIIKPTENDEHGFILTFSEQRKLKTQSCNVGTHTA